MATISELRVRAPRNRCRLSISTPDSSPHAHELRNELLQEICEFIARYDLAVTPMNLATICGALSGSSPQLSEALAMREVTGEPIDQRWLDELIREEPEITGRIAALEKLMDELEHSITHFSVTAKNAKHETGDQRDALCSSLGHYSEQIGGVETVSDEFRIFDVSHSVLERISRVETAMAKSESEANVLRESLAKARMEADLDHLTGLPNRRAFERRLDFLVEQVRMKNATLCVAFCDVDYFKVINENFGHGGGDEALCNIARLFGEFVDNECFVARHGGEEFALLFYDLGQGRARNRVEEIRRRIDQTPILTGRSNSLSCKVTISGGIAEMLKDESPRDLLSRADAALFEAKNAGRNRIVAAEI